VIAEINEGPSFRGCREPQFKQIGLFPNEQIRELCASLGYEIRQSETVISNPPSHFLSCKHFD